MYNRFLKRRDALSALTFVLGFDSEPIQAEKSLYNLAQWVRKQPELAAALANISSEQFTTAYRKQAADPYARQATAEAARQQATQSLPTRLHGLRLRLFQRLIGTAQRYAPLREDALADAGLSWPVLRRMLREIGRRLTGASAIASPDDVFWLTLDELHEATTALDAGQPPANYHAVVAERHATWERERAVTPPAVLPLKGGARFLGIDFSSVMPARIEQPTGDVLKGIGASPGRVTGPARVIFGPDEFGQMRQVISW